MSGHIVKVLETGFVTQNVKRFVVEKPNGYSFISGQAADISINKPGLENELRPFTFTSVDESDILEFIIKIYSDHDGVTNNLGKIIAGDELILHDVFGTITYHGSGLFIAGGAGITPFISIFRHLRALGKLSGNTLLFANRTMEDIILKDELQDLLGGNFINVIEKSNDPSAPARFIDRELIETYAGNKDQFYYICGPDIFTGTMIEYLVDLGVAKSQIIIEQYLVATN